MQNETDNISFHIFKHNNICTHRTEHAVGWKWGCHISAHSDCNHFDRSFLRGLLLVFNYWSSGGKDDGPLIPCLPDNLSPRQLTLFSLLDLGDKSTATLIIKDSGLASTNRCLCQVQVTFRSDSLDCDLQHFYGGLDLRGESLGEELRENGIKSLKRFIKQSTSRKIHVI